MSATHIFLDESGFTGQDLINPFQPVFCIASTILDGGSAEKYHADLLEKSNAREAKHNRLMRRPFGRTKIADFLQRIKEEDIFAVWVCHKRFALLASFVDIWLETLARRDGFDLYEDGAALAISNMTYFCLPAFTNDAFMDSILRDFQNTMISRTKQSYDRLLLNLVLKYNGSDQNVQDLIVPFLAAVDILGYEYLGDLPQPAINLGLTGLVRICHVWREQKPGPFMLHHDQSTQLARDRSVWEPLLSEDMPAAEFGTGNRHVVFPVNVQGAVFVDSIVEKQIQLCDVVAGAVATWSRGFINDQNSEYLELLREVDLSPLLKAVVWPEPEVDPDKLGTRGLSGAMLDYLTGELAKREK